MIDTKKIYNLVIADVTAYPHIRIGQSLFNNLYKEAPELANYIRGTWLDSYYQDVTEEGVVVYLMYVHSLYHKYLEGKL